MLGFVSMFMDISSELIHGLLPVFMVSVLGASMLSVGIIEGIAESVALIVKVFSGVISDWLGRRKGPPLGCVSHSTPWVHSGQWCGAVIRQCDCRGVMGCLWRGDDVLCRGRVCVLNIIIVVR